MPTSIITQAGLNAAINAQQDGLQIAITSFQLSSTIPALPLSTSATAVPSPVVFTGTQSDLTYTVNTTNTALTITITLNQSIGPFAIGSIGWFLSNGTMFALTALDQLDYKTSTNTTSGQTIEGNIRSFLLTIDITNSPNIIDTTVIAPAYLSLPTLSNETFLPVSLGPYNAYLINDFTQTDISSIAIFNGTGWSQIRAIKNTSDSAVIFPGISALGFAEGSAIAWNGTEIVLYDPSTLDVYIGVMGQSDLVYRDGIFTISTGTPYTVGANYYCGTGANAGMLTANTPAVTTNNNEFLIVGYANTSNSLILNSQCSQFLAQLGSNYLIDNSNTVNTVSVIFDSVINTLPIGYTFSVLIKKTNSGAVTLQSNVINASLIDYQGNSISAGSIVAGSISMVIWNGTSFCLLNPYYAWRLGNPILQDVGVTNALSVSLIPAITSYTEIENTPFTLIPKNSNNAACTITINGLATIPIYQNNVNLNGGELIANNPYSVIIISNVMYITGSSAGTLNTAPATSNSQTITLGQTQNYSLSPKFNTPLFQTSATVLSNGIDTSASLFLDSTTTGGQRFSLFSNYNTNAWGLTNLTSNYTIISGSGQNVIFSGQVTSNGGFYLNSNSFFMLSGSSTVLNLITGASINTSTNNQITISTGTGAATFNATGILSNGTINATQDLIAQGTYLQVGYGGYAGFTNQSTASQVNSSVNIGPGSALSLVSTTYNLTLNNAVIATFTPTQNTIVQNTTFSENVTVSGSLQVTGVASAAAGTSGNQLVNYTQLVNGSLSPILNALGINNLLSFLTGGSNTVIYSDSGSNDFVVRTGPASTPTYTVFDSTGDLTVPGSIISNGNQVVTLADYISQFNPTGQPSEFILPNGLIIKVGQGVTFTTIVFPTAFPNKCMYVFPVLYQMPVSLTLSVDYVSASSFAAGSIGSSKLNPVASNIFYLAIGN